MPRPPGEPGYFDKVNYVIDAWSRPCDAPWYIYVEALWPAALDAFITLATFGWDDVARGYWRPRGLGRRTGKKPGRGRRRRPVRFPELGEEIGKRLPGADAVKGRKWGWGGKALWRLDEKIQQTLFWWLVADVTIDFAYNFTSVLYETAWCQASKLGRFSYTATEDHVSAPNHWTVVHFDDKDYQFAPPGWAHNQGGTGSRSCLVAAAVTLEPAPGQPAPSEVQIRIVGQLPSNLLLQAGPDEPDDPDKADIIISGNVPPFTSFEVQVNHDGGFSRITDGVVTAMENVV